MNNNKLEEGSQSTFENEDIQLVYNKNPGSNYDFFFRIYLDELEAILYQKPTNDSSEYLEYLTGFNF